MKKIAAVVLVMIAGCCYAQTSIGGGGGTGGGGGGGCTHASNMLLVAGDGSGGCTTATPQIMATTAIDSSATSMYLSSANPTVTGSVIDNLVMGVDAGSHLAPGAASTGGQANVILGHAACGVATSMRETVCIGDNAGAAVTGNGTGADDMIGVYIGSLAAASLTNLGGGAIAIGQKAGLTAVELDSTVIIGTHNSAGLLRDGLQSGSDPDSGRSDYIGSGILDDGLVPNYVTNRNDFMGNSVASLAVANSVLNDNVAIGHKAIQNIDGTAGGSSGSENVSIGSQSGQQLSTGFDNIFIGYTAGSGNAGTALSGSRNLLMFSQSGNGLTTGSHNWLLDGGGFAINTGSNNYCLGPTTCNGLNGGSNNIAIGSSAMGFIAVNRNVNNVIGIGGAAAKNAQVDGMVSVGYHSGLLATGSGDTFLGNFASGDPSGGVGITSGSNDTCIGDTTCQTPTTESGLTEIGEGADSAVGVSNSAEIGAGQCAVSSTLCFLGTPYLTGGGLTNGVTATTQSSGDNTAKVATDAFVKSQFIASGTPTFTPGTNVTSTVCASGYTCTNTRGEITLVGGTATTGTIATVNFSATLGAAPFCSVGVNGNGGSSTTFFDLGHGTPSTSSFTITAGVTVIGATINIDYSCQP